MHTSLPWISLYNIIIRNHSVQSTRFAFLQQDVRWRFELGYHRWYCTPYRLPPLWAHLCEFHILTVFLAVSGFLLDGLRNYFSQFGKVDACTIMRDPAGRSRGFAFLTFEDPAAVNAVMVREHYLDGKIVGFFPSRCRHSPFSTTLPPRPSGHSTLLVFLMHYVRRRTADQFPPSFFL